MTNQTRHGMLFVPVHKVMLNVTRPCAVQFVYSWWPRAWPSAS